MKLSEMTNEQKSRWIVEQIEPKPSERPSWSHAESPLRAWTSSFKGFLARSYPPNQEGYPDPWYEWRPQNFITDPTMTVMLLEKLLVHHDVKIERGGTPAYLLLFFDGEKWRGGDAETLGQAVADAWMLSAGYRDSE